MPDFQASDGRRIAFDDTGAGAPLLCLAGLTRDSRDFEPLIPHLDGYRVITMDYRGRGRSEWAEDPIAEYTLPVEGRDAVELLAHLGLSAATIIGTSRGGLIGMGLAVQMPGLVTALVLNDIGPKIDEGGIASIAAHLGRPVKFADVEAAARQLMATYGAFAPDMTLADWKAQAKRTFHEIDGELTLSYDPKLLDAVVASGTSDLPELWDLFDAIDCPILGLRGENSNLLGADTFAEMSRRKPDMVAALIPNRGHCPILDEPASLEALLPFLKVHA